MAVLLHVHLAELSLKVEHCIEHHTIISHQYFEEQLACTLVIAFRMKSRLPPNSPSDGRPSVRDASLHHELVEAV